MQDSPFIRPRGAALISACALAGAVVIGLVLIRSLDAVGDALRRGGRAAATLHGYTAAVEVWRDLGRREDRGPATAEADSLQDSIRAALTAQLKELRAELVDPADHALVDAVITGLRASDPGLPADARRALIQFLEHQDEAMFAAAEELQRAVRYSAVLLALTVVAAGVFVVPMAWLYTRLQQTAAGAAAGR